jgi:tRNA(fMet)-specific endonuclease VapC
MVSAILDTNIVIALFEGDKSVLDALDLTPEVYLPIIVIGELCHGAFNSDNIDENLERIDAFSSDCILLECDGSTAREYGKVKTELRRKGKRIPENDIWIAACALQNDKAIATRDSHFEEVSGIQILRW